MNFYSILKHAHSGLRYFVIIFLLLAIITSFMNWQKNKSYTASDKRWPLMAMIFCHIQLILGLILYFISPMVRFSGDVMKDAVGRFYTVEHISLMIIALILITVGHAKGKRLIGDVKRYKVIFTYYLIGFILIMVSIPWPFRALGAGWG